MFIMETSVNTLYRLKYSHLMNIFLIRWNVGKALEAARQKLQLSLQIKDDIMTSLPSTYLEVYEIHRIAQVRELVDEKK